MLVLCTFHLNHDLESKTESRLALETIRRNLLEQSQRVDPKSFEDEALDVLFNSFMEYSEIIFAPSSKSRVFDYHTSLIAKYPDLARYEQGRIMFSLIEAVDEVWQDTQAPVAELVEAGKHQLIKVNGGANYTNFSKNAEDFPDVFGTTKLLVDNYLLLDFYIMLLDAAIADGQTPPMAYLRGAQENLREFAARGRAIGFWSAPISEKSEILKDLKVETFSVLS